MVIRPGQYISAEGRVYHPYLAGWKPDVSDVTLRKKVSKRSFRGKIIIKLSMSLPGNLLYELTVMGIEIKY